MGAFGHEPQGLCEIDDGAIAVLEKRFPGVRLRRDICTLRAIPRDVELVKAGFPCHKTQIKTAVSFWPIARSVISGLKHCSRKPCNCGIVAVQFFGHVLSLHAWHLNLMRGR